MKTEREYGYEFGQWMRKEGQDGAVDINEACHDGIPDEDYTTMVREGIDNPQPRPYWLGYNEAMSEEAE